MARILVLGTVAEDQVVGLSQPLVSGSHQDGIDKGVRLGGGGANAAVALARAGDTALLVAALGSDAVGDGLLSQLTAIGVDLSLCLRLDGPSSRSLVMTDPLGERSIVNLKRLLESEPPRRILTAPADALYVRSRHLGLAPLMAEMTARMPVIAHVPPTSPNAVPAQILVGSESDLDGDFLADPFAHGMTVSGGRLQWIVVTRGAKGAEAFGPHGQRLFQPARKVDVIDSTGAGDAFAAGLAHAVARQLPMEEALNIAVAWGTAATRYESSAPGVGFPPIRAD
ncbi:MAG: PfkB family carbohydrate kinase [Rhodospirillales bacterium]|nr:PfkB family carbohydrate kinase [Rhodospirillales bacterium]